MRRSFYAHVPFRQVLGAMDFFLAKGVNPEISFNGEDLDNVLPEEFEAVADALAKAGLSCTIHAPFMDLNPGSEERLIRETTARRFTQVCDAALILRPVSMVFHPGYDRWRYGEKQSTWLGNTINTFTKVLEMTEPTGCRISIENIFEEEPSTLLALMEAFNHPRLRHCFDVGHWNLFATKTCDLDEWFSTLGAYMGHLHIHDNYGLKDDHAPVGEGNIDFDLYFALVKKYATEAVWTLEAHNRLNLERTLKGMAKYGET